MSKALLQFTRQMQWALIPLLLLVLTQQARSQCTNGSQYPSTSIDLAATNSSGATTTITTCNFSGEYSVLINAVGGNSYRFTSSIATDYFTIRSGSPGGPVVGFGTQPLIVTPGSGGTLYAHVNSSAACLSDVSCRQTAVQCTSCSGGGCVNSTVYPSLNISLNPTNTSGTPQQITSCQFSGEYYSVIDVIAGKSYTFSSSVGTDWITVRTGVFNGAILGQGAGAVTVTPSTTATLFIHNNSNSSCGTNSTCRVSTVQCTNCLCQNSSQFPSTAVSLNPTNTTGAVQTVTTCNFASEYFVLTNVLSPKNYTITSSVSTDWLTVRVGSAGGAVLAQGTTPLAITTTSTADLYVHVNTNASCGTSSACRITAVQCTNCAGAPPCVVSPTFPTNGSTICPNSNVTLSWPASAGATSYDVYFGTTAVPPFVANVATTSFNVGVQTTGTRFWEIRPRNGAGPAPGCAIWTFTLADNTAPSITCPANVTGNNSPATACSAVMTYGAISATDACGAPSIVLQSGLASGSVFPVGINVVVFRATDPSGNTATCSFTVTVVDATLPNITCPANITDVNDPGICGAAESYATPTATDNCSIATVALQSGQLSGTSFPVGTTTNVWRATDVNGNTRTCSFTVTVSDNEAPDPVCPPDLLKNNDFGDCGRTIPYLGNLTFTDNCGVVATANDSPGFFPVGTTVVTFVVTDNSGNTGTCTQSVTIYDYEYPYVTCPANITTQADEFECAALVDYTAVGSDNCPGLTLTYSTDPQSSFEIGYTNVTATVVDAAGNSVNCTFQIHIKPRVEICNDYDDDCDGYTDEAQDWAKVAKRLAKDGAAFDQYGISVDIDGEWAVVGSNKKDQSGANLGGSAYLLRRGADGWFGVLRLQPTDILPGDNFGLDVAISGGVVAVGSPSDDDVAGNAGSVYLYYQNPDNPNDWTLLKKIYAPDSSTGDNFGGAVDLSGEWLLVGAALKDVTGIDEGQAYVFGRNQDGTDEWGHVAKLNAPNGEANDQFGASVALDGGKAIVGAPGDDDKGAEAGAAYRFDRNQGGADNWGYVAKLLGAQTSGGDAFGKSVAISGPYAVVGAPQNDIQGADAGVAFAFYQNSGSPNGWGQSTFMTNPNGQAGDHFGAGVAIDGEYAVVTAPGDNPHGAGSGQGFVFLLVDQGWGLVDQLSDGDGQTNDGLGYSVALSGRTALLGAPNDDKGVAQEIGSVAFFEGLCTDDATKQALVRDEASASNSTLDVQCYPVPFTDVLTIEVNTTAAVTRISVFNTLGQEIQVVGTDSESGRYLWQAGKMQPGLYYVKVQAGDQVQTKSVLLARP